jgi:hypothetical protein
MANSGSGGKSGSGNRRPPGTGNRSSATRRSGAPSTPQKPGVSRASTGEDADAEKFSADERARERLSQSKSGGGSGGRRPPPRGGSRPSGKPDQRKGQQRSASATAGIFGGAFVVLAVIVIILISTLSTTASAAGQPIAWKPITPAMQTALAGITPAQFAAAGTGGSQLSVSTVFVLTPKQALLIKGGKPVLVYEGAEYCPYCGASRWPLIIALDRFGSFTGLGTIGSSPYDVYASTHTFSFQKAQYTSKYLVFEPSEQTTNICEKGQLVSGACGVYTPLQATSPANAKLATTYDTEKYYPADTTNEAQIPFLDWGGLSVSAGALYSPEVINEGDSQNGSGWHPLTWNQIIATLSIPSTGAGQAILGTANIYTAAICNMTHNQPGSVCNTPVIQSAKAELAKA